MLYDHAHAMQVKLCKASTRGVTNIILDHWKMYFHGSLKLGGAGAGVLLISLDGKQLKYVLQILWQATNNEAEYEALIHGV